MFLIVVLLKSEFFPIMRKPNGLTYLWKIESSCSFFLIPLTWIKFLPVFPHKTPTLHNSPHFNCWNHKYITQSLFRLSAHIPISIRTKNFKFERICPQYIFPLFQCPEGLGVVSSGYINPLCLFTFYKKDLFMTLHPLIPTNLMDFSHFRAALIAVERN